MALFGKCVESEPSSFEEVVQQLVWVDAMVEEYNSIVQNCVWDVVPRPQDKLVVSSRWLDKVKQVANGSVEKHTARFVAHGFSQVKGIDYDETFAPVARYSSIIFILALSTQMGWKIHQMDMKATFLNGKIKEEVYIEKPEGFETFDRESHVCQLKRALYGLKQAPHDWYTKINNYFIGLGFTKVEENANLYHIMVECKPLIIVIYVDDLILTSDLVLQGGPCKRVRDERHGSYALLSRHGRVAERWGSFFCLKASMPMRYSGRSTWRSESPCRLL